MNKVLELVIAFLALFALFSAGVAQHQAYTPEASSAERKAIVDALRGPLSRELKKRSNERHFLHGRLGHLQTYKVIARNTIDLSNN